MSDSPDDVIVESIIAGEISDNIIQIPEESKKKRTRRRKNTRKNGGTVAVESILESVQTLNIAADVPLESIPSQHLPSGVPGKAEVDFPLQKQNQTRPRKKKNSPPTAFNYVECSGNIPGSLFLKPIEETQPSFSSFDSEKRSSGIFPKSNNYSTSGKLFLKPVDEADPKPGSSTDSTRRKNRTTECVPSMKGKWKFASSQQETSETSLQSSRTRSKVTKVGKTEENHFVSHSQRKRGKNVSKNSTEEPVLDENKFDDHLQWELVEVLMKTQKSYIKGSLRINQRNFREAYIHNPDGGKDILIDGVKFRNRGLEGDEVVVEVLPESAWRIHDGNVQKTGKVVHILSTVHHRQAVGSLKQMPDKNSKNALFSPRDSRVPRMRVPLKECPKDMAQWENQLFCARITDWDDVRFAKGQIVGESVGVQGDIEAETLAIMIENELDFRPYDQKLYKFFPTPPYNIHEKDLAGREDLRKKCIFTIDPQTAKDLDDAVSCEELESGNYKVGVHISDVSHFLSEGTPLDIAVSKRATTTYLVQKVYHMLPRDLTMMCSLLPGEDKLAFSVFWEITPKAVVLSHYFTRSVINSCAQLSYEHAQIMIDNPDYEWKDGELPKIHGQWCVKALRDVVCALQKLAVIMRNGRFDGGALRVDQTKLVFHLDDSGLPASLNTYVNKDSHRLIEEFMLLANMTVATALQERFPKIAFLRCHDEPQADMMKRLADTLEKIGIIIDVSSAGSLHKSLQHYGNSEDRIARARFIAMNVLCSKPMARARYFSAGSIGDVQYMRHYALNVPLYTHFTSPIRRYADIMVHRLLSALLRYSEEPKWTMDHVNTIASVCNKQKFCAKRAGEQSSELFFALWVGQCGSLEEDAVVIDVKDHSFDAIVCATGTLVRVYTDKVAGAVEFFSAPVPLLKIVWGIAGGLAENAQQLISLFSVVRVALRKSVVNSLKIDATLVPPLPVSCA